MRHLPRLASGEILGSFALTEPNAGSDAAGIETTIVDKGDHWLLNGHKQWITNGDMAEVIIVFATVDRKKELMGITPVIIEKDFPGFSTGKIEQTLGIRGCHQTELFFEDVKVPKENTLGGLRNVGKGFMVAMDTLDGGRIGVGAGSCGIAQACLEEASRRAKTREQFGKPIAKFQAIQWFIADMATKLEAARQLTLYAAWKKDNAKRCTTEAAMAKLFASEVCNEIADMNLQVHGGYGYTNEFPAERHLRDARIKEIYEGTSEIQRLVIARNILKQY
jgi:butyryl-CoA dehydrogenase